MRLWSLHPKYLDARGLVALWRESLLAQKVLQGLTVGYRSHPQLRRFQSMARPVAAIATYLEPIHAESLHRGYHFNAQKIAPGRIRRKITVTSGQLEYELDHLRDKLRKRDRARIRQLEGVMIPDAHPLFRVELGPVEEWEAVSTGENKRKTDSGSL
jgi:hypothetical protein